MHPFKMMFAFAISLYFIFSFIFVQGCGEDDIVTPPSEHFDAEGVIIMDESFTDTVLYVFRGVFRRKFDTLKVPLGTISPHWEIYFLNSDTVRINAPSGSDYSSGFIVGNSAVAQVFQDDPVNEKWAFHLRGLTSGTTTLTIKLNHSGHSDFTTPLIPVYVDSNIIGEATGIKIFYENNGQLIYRDSAGNISGPGFNITAGDTSEHAAVKFYDKSGGLFTPPYPQYNLTGVIGNPAIAGFINEAPAEPFIILIRGISSGSTSLILDLKEGANAVYNSGSVPVNVNP